MPINSAWDSNTVVETRAVFLLQLYQFITFWWISSNFTNVIYKSNIDFYKDEFLKLVNLPYGYNQVSRLKLAQNYTPENWNKLSSEEDEQFFRI